MRYNPFNNLYNSEEFKKPIKKDFPYIVDVELTNHCNLDCRMCSRQLMTREQGYMKWNIFKKIVDECHRYNTPIRFIRWGEPTLHPNFIRMCKYVKKKKLPLHITTNGLLLNNKLMKDIISIKIDSIIFSMQGATKRGYEKMRGEYYDKLASNIKRLIKLRGYKKKPYIHISSTMYDDTKEEIDMFEWYWRGIVDSVGVGTTNMLRVGGDTSPRKVYKPCTEVYQRLSVDWDGKVTACCGDYDNLLTIGDINERSLWDIWNYNPLLDSYRNILDNMQHKCLTLCKDCYHVYESF